MTPFTTFAGALVLGLVVASALLFGGAPLLVLPIIALLALGLVVFLRGSRRDRAIAEHRQRATSDKVEFTERDKETLYRR